MGQGETIPTNQNGDETTTPPNENAGGLLCRRGALPWEGPARFALPADRDPKMRASEICPPTRSLARLAPQPSPDNQAAPPALQGGRAVAATRTRVNDTPATNSAASSRRQHHEAHRPHLSSWFEPWLV